MTSERDEGTTDEARDRYTDVLNAFIDKCPDPSPHEIAAWTEAFPQYAEEIRRTAADALAINRITGGRRGPPPTEAEVDAEFAKIAPSLGFGRLTTKRKGRPGRPGLER